MLNDSLSSRLRPPMPARMEQELSNEAHLAAMAELDCPFTRLDRDFAAAFRAITPPIDPKAAP